MVKYFSIFIIILIFAVGSVTAIYLPPYLERQQKLRDRSFGCINYRQMVQKSDDSYQLNPSGSTWKREGMAAAGLLKKHRHTPKK